MKIDIAELFKNEDVQKIPIMYVVTIVMAIENMMKEEVADTDV